MEFSCKYAKPSGEIVESVLVGQNADEVRHHLQEQGLLPMMVRPRGVGFSLSRRKRKEVIKPDDFILFNQQFVQLIRAGLPILRSLDLLKMQIKNPALARYISDIRDRVHSGAMLSEALRAQGVFPAVYNASIFAGERSGNLVEVITRYIHYEKTFLGVRKRFINSLIYPGFLIVLTISMVLVIVAFVIPRFAELYTGLSVALPTPTRILIGVSGAVQSNLYILIPAVIAVIVGLVTWSGTAGGRRGIDEFKLKAPIVGRLWTMFSMAQLSRTLATLLQGGTPLVAALEVARDSSGNSVISHSIAGAIVEVREGKPLSDSLERTGHFPQLALEMIHVGEQTGALPEMLNHMADYYDEDVNIGSAALLSFVEPVILVFVAIFVAAVLISLYLPLFSLGSHV